MRERRWGSKVKWGTGFPQVRCHMFVRRDRIVNVIEVDTMQDFASAEMSKGHLKRNKKTQ
jgi:hypothetical protein